MTEMTLEASLREKTGKSHAAQLRREGELPGVVYGVKEPTSIKLNAREATKLVHAVHGSERLVALNVKDAKGKDDVRQVLMKEVQTTAVGGIVLHIDFHEIDVSKTVHVAVEIRPLGKAAGEKFGGILQTVSHEISIECLPAAIPDHIDVDVSPLEIGHSLHVSDVVLPEGLKTIGNPEETLFVVAAPAVEVEPSEEVEEGAVEEGAEEADAEKTEAE